jgi:cellulose 1,4-beta-cellobiosidase
LVRNVYVRTVCETNTDFVHVPLDVDLSGLPCGFNGALYFVSMDADGGLKKYSTNKAGAKYGTGYCDAQCPRDLKACTHSVRNVPM